MPACSHGALLLAQVAPLRRKTAPQMNDPAAAGEGHASGRAAVRRMGPARVDQHKERASCCHRGCIWLRRQLATWCVHAPMIYLRTLAVTQVVVQKCCHVLEYWHANGTD